MSGGHFDYNRYRIHVIADEIERLILRNGKEPVNESYWRYEYTPETIKEFQTALDTLRKAALYVQRIDWLVSGDDSEESFHNRLNEELAVMEEYKKIVDYLDSP